MTTREVMDVGELAEYLGIASSTVYKWVEHRKIPFTKVGNLLRFPKWLIDGWLTKTATMPEDELFDEFVRMKKRYHLEKWLQAEGLARERASAQEIEEALKEAIALLKPEGVKDE